MARAFVRCSPTTTAGSWTSDTNAVSRCGRPGIAGGGRGGGRDVAAVPADHDAADGPLPGQHRAGRMAASITGILRLYFGSDELSFSASSSAANLVVNPRHYTRLTQVGQEMVDVRIYQGIHLRTADELGRFHGGRVAHWTFQKFLRPLPGTQ